MSDHHTLNRVERACADLRHQQHAVTFTAIAAATGISRTTLYRNPDLRAVIDQHRHTSSDALTSITDEVATLRAAVDTLATRVRRHEEQIRRLTPRQP
jgi:hypothetical protein